jgi:hypothetical protein
MTTMNRLLIALLVFGIAEAAEEFRSAPVVESYSFERSRSLFNVGGVAAGGVTSDMNRVTVVIDGMRITGEFESKTVRSTSAKDFRLGADVLVALERNKLLLTAADGSVVTAKIVRREKQQPPQSAGRARN